ncbi:EmrB/QacA subfamily drug resistance transporter [Saccharopolyspora erythraea NRRL 2338]|uniref:Multidrug transporter, MFS superfamily n=2 Tax=Saccharopolyspora erythraea TaxID=1836 RepID=A4F6R4_SACEN|nr:MDR family MFS transporter [Saccharopolyspora erythraea]EQD87272.1 major facilitator transporter [Saccharopolyspora erythraea D]PFG93541.1 EmrB/QacA subfamily drug resistance transporter [Saccharopolyspora erythraea NRRL 2338]CAL99738.1 multidrug transporter, MFS superfamily [Saccharopolyspora erythraea NRRL 2338]
MSETAERAAPAPPGVRLTHRQILTVLTGLMLGMFLGALDQTIVSSAIRVIADQLHGQTAQAWVTTAYLITATITTPLYGKLSDIYGRKPLYLAAISLFLLGSVLCGLANSIYELAAFRAIQGLGGGGLMSLALTIIADMLPPRERSRYQGYFMAVFGVSSVVGPVIGGLFAGMDSFLGFAGWRWVFLVNVPVGLIALVVVAKVLNVETERVRHRIDYWGAAALVVMLVPLLTVAEQGREWGWGSATSLAMYAIGAVGLVLFVVSERRMGDEALLPLRMFRLPSFRMGNVLNFIVGVGMFGGLMSMPLYLQIVKGLDPTAAGMLMLTMTAGIMISTTIAGRAISKTGRLKPFPVIGSGIMTVALLLFSRLTADTSLVQVGLIAVVMGLGLGLLMQTLTLVVQADATRTDLGVATASVNLFRQTGGTVGAAVFLSVLFSTVGGRIADAMRAAAVSPEFTAALRDPAVLADPANRDFLAGMRGGAPPDLNDTSFLYHLDPRLARPVLEGFASAMGTVFFVGACVVGVAFVLTWFLRDTRLD